MTRWRRILAMLSGDVFDEGVPRMDLIDEHAHHPQKIPKRNYGSQRRRACSLTSIRVTTELTNSRRYGLIPRAQVGAQNANYNTCYRGLLP